MNSSRAARAPKPAPCLRTWPIQITDYDCRSRLTTTEQRVLTRELPRVMETERTVRAMLGKLSGLERLLTPINDALAVVDGKRVYGDRVRLMLLQHCAMQRTTFWAWDATVWRTVIGTTQEVFYAAHVPKPYAGGERQALMSVAYLLRCFDDIPSLGGVKRVALAEKIFGKERITATLKQVTDISTTWGYRNHCKPLMSLIAELLLINQRPDLESLTGEFIESIRARCHNSNYRSSLYFQLARVLAALGILPAGPEVRNGVDRESIHEARIAGIAAAWVSTVERWEATSTLTVSTRGHMRDMVLKAGRWLQACHPEITCAGQWTGELAAEYVGAVERMHVGDYVWRTAAVGMKLGKPATARSKDAFLVAMRCFFANIQEWEWIPRRFDPFRAFATNWLLVFGWCRICLVAAPGVDF